MPAIIVLTAVSNSIEAETLARKIVEAKLAACVQILPQMKAVYFWQGAIQTDSENLLLIKTQPQKFDELKDFIESNHDYDVPEIVAIAADKISEKYSRWLGDYLN